jgi:hypothetical protein
VICTSKPRFNVINSRGLTVRVTPDPFPDLWTRWVLQVFANPDLELTGIIVQGLRIIPYMEGGEEVDGTTKNGTVERSQNVIGANARDV